MKDHAENNALELCCPLDRGKILDGHVFKDKGTERTVLNLSVKCKNYGEDCAWTGDLRDALEHETKCPKNAAPVNGTFECKFQQLLTHITKLEIKIQNNEEKNNEKEVENDKIIETQSKQIENLKEEVANHIKENGNQIKRLEKLEQCVHKYETMFLIPNVERDIDFAPLSTAFQWKFQHNEIRSTHNTKFYSPPFYNVESSNCFQMLVFYENNKFTIGLARYRGKYDHPTSSINKTKAFVLITKIFGKNGKQKDLEFNSNEFSISPNKMLSERCWQFEINNGEMVSLTIDGYVHLHCFFQGDKLI